MNYSETQLSTVEQLASIYMKITDIALIIEVDATVLRQDIDTPSSEVSRAYRKGKALSKVALHQQEMNLAKVGSPLALENARQNLLDMEDDE